MIAATRQSAGARPPGRRLWLLAAVVALSACSTLRTERSTSLGVFHDNARLGAWQLRGKIGIVAGGHANAGYLNWRQCDDRYEIRINGPLGSGAAKLVGDDSGVTLYESNHPPVSAPTPEQLLAQYPGWDLPISELRYWIRGVPSPAEDFQSTADGFSQSGWVLTFPRQAQVGTFVLPAKAVATSKRARVTLVFQQWQLHPDCGESR